MKTIEHTIEVDATPEEVFGFLVDEEFVAGLEPKLDKISNIDRKALEELADGRLRRVSQFTAPADLPRFLRRFKDRAPDEVRWDEIAILDPARHEMTFEIVPDVPEHWHERYESKGRLTATDAGNGRSRVTQIMEYSVDSPALGFVITRAIGKEISNIFEAQADLIRERFR